MSFMITRDNYEEFFLLYVDNELSAAERRLVESWVAENPDLTEEWELLLQCRIAPDQHLAFTGKESLFRQEEDQTAETGPAGQGSGHADHLTGANHAIESHDGGHTISIYNYEEYFLLYIDGQLDEKTRKSVEEFVLRHPSLHAELSSLQRTVSVPDPAIVFANKEALYRKEKERRIVFFPWRIAAAALVAGVTGLLIFNTFKKGPEGSLVSAPKPAGSSVAAGSAPSPGAQPPVKIPDSPNTLESALPENPVAHPELIAQTGPTSNPGEKTTGTKNPGTAVTPRSSSTLHLSEAGQNKIAAGAARTAGQQRSPATVKQQEDPGDKALVQTEPLEPVKTRGIDPQTSRTAPGVEGPTDRTLVLATPVANHTDTRTKENSFATQALLSSSNGSPDDGLAMEDSPSKKNKLRGLFRKVTRVLEKTTSRDEDDHRSVLVGSFQFALK